MADIRLKVSPDELKRKAAQIQGQITDAQKNWNSLCETANAAKHYWEGEAAEYRRRLLEETQQEMQEVFQRLKQHPSDLLEMAGIYLDVETKTAELVKSLPDDAIQ